MTKVIRSRAFYIFLVASALLVNAAGYLLNLWHDETVFDELVHFYTSFCGIGAIAWVGGRRGILRRPPRWWTLLIIGLVLGIAWEGVEWLVDIIGSTHDTLMDLAMDGAGALVATLLSSAAFADPDASHPAK